MRLSSKGEGGIIASTLNEHKKKTMTELGILSASSDKLVTVNPVENTKIEHQNYECVSTFCIVYSTTRVQQLMPTSIFGIK